MLFRSMSALDAKIREHYNFDGAAPTEEEAEQPKPAKKGKKEEE